MTPGLPRASRRSPSLPFMGRESRLKSAMGGCRLSPPPTPLRRRRTSPQGGGMKGVQSERLRLDAGADLAGDASAAEAAIALRVLGEILLVVVLGEVEGRR